MTFSITEEEQILYLVSRFVEKHNLRDDVEWWDAEIITDDMSEGISRDALALVADIVDIFDPGSEVIDEDAITTFAINRYGETAQIMKCIEELAELQAALYNCLTPTEMGGLDYINVCLLSSNTIKAWCKTNISKGMKLNTAYLENLHGELADTRIMMTQIEKIFDCRKAVNAKEQEKLYRLAQRVVPRMEE